MNNEKSCVDAVLECIGEAHAKGVNSGIIELPEQPDDALTCTPVSSRDFPVCGDMLCRTGNDTLLFHGTPDSRLVGAVLQSQPKALLNVFATLTMARCSDVCHSSWLVASAEAVDRITQEHGAALEGAEWLVVVLGSAKLKGELGLIAAMVSQRFFPGDPPDAALFQGRDWFGAVLRDTEDESDEDLRCTFRRSPVMLCARPGHVWTGEQMAEAACRKVDWAGVCDLLPMLPDSEEDMGTEHVLLAYIGVPAAVRELMAIDARGVRTTMRQNLNGDTNNVESTLLVQHLEGDQDAAGGDDEIGMLSTVHYRLNLMRIGRRVNMPEPDGLFDKLSQFAAAHPMRVDEELEQQFLHALRDLDDEGRNSVPPLHLGKVMEALVQQKAEEDSLFILQWIRMGPGVHRLLYEVAKFDPEMMRDKQVRALFHENLLRDVWRVNLEDPAEMAEKVLEFVDRHRSDIRHAAIYARGLKFYGFLPAGSGIDVKTLRQAAAEALEAQ